MREIDGMSYADLAAALDVTVPAVKSLLVRARVGLVEAAEARDADCQEIQADLMRAYDRGVKASGRARKHMRSCDSCREYRTALRGMKRSFAALSPIGFAPFAFAAKLIGLGGSAGGGVAASGAAAGGGSAAVAGSGVAALTACKVAAVVCTAAIATGGAVEVKREIVHRTPAPAASKTHKAKTAAKTTPAAAAPVVIEAKGRPQVASFDRSPAQTSTVSLPAKKHKAARKAKATPAPVVAPPAETKATTDVGDEPVVVDPQAETGGALAPDAPTVAVPSPVASPAPTAPIAANPQPTPVPATDAGAVASTPPDSGGASAPTTPSGVVTPPAGG
jgi:hypothetical protein